jgi:hypothetical protein
MSYVLWRIHPLPTFQAKSEGAFCAISVNIVMLSDKTFQAYTKNINHPTNYFNKNFKTLQEAILAVKEFEKELEDLRIFK